MVAAIPLMRLLDGHEIEHQNGFFFLKNLEDDRIASPDMHTVDLFSCKQAFHVRSMIRVLQHPKTVVDLNPVVLGKFLKSLDNVP